MANRISLCLIVKNGAATLTDCLRSVADLVHELIVVDTGSTDATKPIAAAQEAELPDEPFTLFNFAWSHVELGVTTLWGMPRA